MTQSQPSDASPAAEKIDFKASQPAAERMRAVLIVDDDEMVRRVSSRMLSGSDILVAESGDEACRVLRELGNEPVDCVLLDMKMPGLSFEESFECIRKIRPDLPVVACSGNGPHSVGRDFYDTPRTGFLGKPFTRQELNDAIDRAILGSGAGD